MSFNFTAFSDSDITMKVSEGIYYYEDKPIYIIEHIQEQNSEYVVVYGIQPGQEDNPVKKHTMIRELQTIPGGTALSDMIKSRIPKKVKMKKKDDPPIFIADVLPDGIDSVKKIHGKGFFERTPDQIIIQESGRKIQPGKYTGVFIVLDTIDWKRSYTPLESVIEYYKAHKEGIIDV